MSLLPRVDIQTTASTVVIILSLPVPLDFSLLPSAVKPARIKPLILLSSVFLCSTFPEVSAKPHDSPAKARSHLACVDQCLVL